MKTDVLIVGAGPTGLSLACQLMRYGVDFVIVDAKDGTTPYSKAIGVQARTLEIYEQINLAAPLVAAGNIAGKVNLIEGGEVRGTMELSRVGEGLSRFPFLLIVEQGKHEAILYDHIRAGGRDVRWNTSLESFVDTGDGVEATLVGGETVEARFLVGCDGAKSVVRHALGLGFEGSTLERLFYVADAAVDWKFGSDALAVCLAKHTITAFFPMVGDKRFRIVGTFPENTDKTEGEVLYDEIERQIRADTELELDISDVRWFSTYKVHSRRVEKFSRGRCFLAGDAAHIHTPAGAQGMNTGIQDGYNLAWKLAAVLRGHAGDKLLETYDEERSANASRLLRTTDLAFGFGAADDPVTSFVRTKIFPHVAGLALSFDAVRKAVFPLVSQIGINYRDARLSDTEGGGFKVRAGDRLPYLTIDGVALQDRLTPPKFHVVTFFDGVSRPPRVPEHDMLNSFELPLYPVVAETFGVAKTFTMLVRPDNYIGLLTTDETGESVENWVSGKLKG